MVHRGHKIVIAIPAGRRRYMDLLVRQLSKLRSVVDECHVWFHTDDTDDQAYLEDLVRADPAFFVAKRLPDGVRIDGNRTIGLFFRDSVDPDTLYVRMDDDVVLVDSLDRFCDFLDFRIDHPEYFLVFANILNNAIVTHIHQRLGTLPKHIGVSGYACMDPEGWANPEHALRLHKHILAQGGSLETYVRAFRQWELHYAERCSINCVAWFGRDFATFGGDVTDDEEHWLTTVAPRQFGRTNVIFGGFAVVHYAFYTQRPAIDGDPEILQQYRRLVGL